ncbi:MAG: hypothetical protein JSS14_22460 [Proteobacteria bacterium]|nr:hypothetical protein [Pseudomonadota bacterium]
MADEPSSALPSDPSQEPSGERSWPPFTTLAELARILTLMHGAHAPTESSLKKWNLNGVFADCQVTEADLASVSAGLPSSSFTREALLRPRRAGRPGLMLDTRRAIGKVHEQWPHLANSSPQAVLDLAVAQTADRLQEAVKALVPIAAPAAAAGPAAGAPSVPDALLAKIERRLDQLDQLHEEVVALRREIAQFSALRNNLITKMDDAVLRAQEALSGNVARAAGGIDPLVEARRDRDMGVLKSTMSEILETLRTLQPSPQ